MRVRSLSLLAGALLVFIPSSSRADRLEGISLFPPTSAYRAGGEIETAAFRLDGDRGSYASLIGRMEWAPTEHIALRARVPVHTLALEGEERTTEGLGDVELRQRFHLMSGEPLRISAGWVTQLPTGSNHAGLGNGALQLTPFVNTGFRNGRVVVYAMVADAVSVASDHQQRRANYIDPGTDHELRVTVGSIFSFTDLVSAAAVLTETTVLTRDEAGRSLLSAGVQLGAQPDRRLRLVLNQQFPVLGEQRFAWKLNVAATYAF